MRASIRSASNCGTPMVARAVGTPGRPLHVVMGLRQRRAAAGSACGVAPGAWPGRGPRRGDRPWGLALGTGPGHRPAGMA